MNMGLSRKGQKPLTKSEAARLQREKLVEITWQKRKTAQDIRRKQKLPALLRKRRCDAKPSDSPPAPARNEAGAT
jgi:hypothetical protein